MLWYTVLSRPDNPRLRKYTPHYDTLDPAGRGLAALGLHPRLAHMVLAGEAAGAAETACLLAALLSERDVLAGRAPSADVALRLQALADPALGALAVVGYSSETAPYFRFLTLAGRTRWRIRL